MAERNIGRPWSAQEDHLLINAVNQHGPGDNWKIIALAVPGRTNKACRKRWLHSLSPSIKKTAWTADEDKRLLELYATHGPKWSLIARQIPGRTDDACSKRYREALDPSLKKDEWTPEEDEQLLQAFARVGGKWGQVGQELKRSGLGCRNRWRMLERRRVVHASKAAPIDSSPVFNTALIELPSVIEQSPINAWPSSSTSSFLLEQPQPPPRWHADLFHGNQSLILQNHPSSPALSHGYSVQCSPHPHELPLEDAPVVPPFRYSSSSLSAALSDTQASQPSPTVNRDVQLESTPIDHSQSSLSGTPTIIRGDVPLLEDNIPDVCSHHATPAPVLISLPDIRDVALDDHSRCGEPSPGSRHYPYDPELSRYDPLIVPLPSSPQSSTDNISLHLPYSPASSLTPHNLSPISSPQNATLHVDLPRLDQGPSKSMLFTPSTQNETPSVRRKPSTPSKRSEQSATARLSSMLPVTSDPTILPYACGHEDCSTSSSIISCFKTSKELSDHCKAEHPDRSGTDRPYRCGLDGCGKSWKSVNGLQYHLQISQAHFQNAISTSFRQKPVSRSVDPHEPSNDSKIARNLHSCTHSGCPKVYRQLSGLRYHLLHGHPKDMPTQLQVVPPTLARRVAERLRNKGLHTQADGM